MADAEGLVGNDSLKKKVPLCCLAYRVASQSVLTANSKTRDYGSRKRTQWAPTLRDEKMRVSEDMPREK